ncbi:MAG: type IV pilin protein [Oleibacter sp.]|nr:type IV pilin protein [Thalassolituus sp.]
MNKNKLKGFTLLELMIVVAIVSILATIAFPSYQSYVQKGNRADAISAMQAILDAQERFYLNNNTYTTDLDDPDPTIGLGFPNDAIALANYNIAAAACGSGLTTCVEITATAIGDQVADGNLIMNTQGRADRDDGAITSLTGR